MIELLQKVRVAESLLRQRVELGALLRAQTVAEPLRRRRTLGQGVEQLVHILRILREMLPVLAHELREVILGVLAPIVLGKKLVEVFQHLADGLTILIRRPFERLLHPREPLIEHLASEQILDLLVVLAPFRGPPVVVRQLLDGLSSRRRQVTDLHLLEPRVVVEGSGERLAFGEHCLVEELTHFLQRAVEVVLLQQLSATPGSLGRQIVEPPHVSGAAPKHLLHRTTRRRPLEHVVADGFERFPQIDRWSQRIRPTVITPVSAGRHQLYTV